MIKVSAGAALPPLVAPAAGRENGLGRFMVAQARPPLSTGAEGPLFFSVESNYTPETTPVSRPGRLFDLAGEWEVVPRSDPVVSGLADRHYPRRARGCGRVGGPHRLIVLRSLDFDAGWITAYTDYPDDGLDVWRCTMFRNEGDRLSSELIRDAMDVTASLWGVPPADGWATYVDTAKVASPNPGYCFKRAGWWRDRSYQPDRRRASLIRLRAA